MPCQHQSTRQNQHRFALKLQNPKIRLFIGVFVAKIYGRGNLSRIADGAEWLLLEVISLSSQETTCRMSGVIEACSCSHRRSH